MKAYPLRSTLSLCWLALLLAGGSTLLGAVIETNPYQTITKRNAFDLKPIPPPDAVTEAPTTPSNIKLSGIIRVDGIKQAMLVVQDGTKNNYLSLAEDEREGAIRIVKIDDDNGTVEILNGPTKLRLNFDDNKLASAAPPPGAGGPGGKGPGGPFPPPGIPQPPGMNGTLPVNRLQPGSTPRTPLQNGEGGVTIPTRTTRTSSTYVAPSSDSGLTAAQSVALMAVYSENIKDNPTITSGGSPSPSGGSTPPSQPIDVPAPPAPPVPGYNFDVPTPPTPGK